MRVLLLLSSIWRNKNVSFRPKKISQCMRDCDPVFIFVFWISLQPLADNYIRILRTEIERERKGEIASKNGISLTWARTYFILLNWRNETERKRKCTSAIVRFIERNGQRELWKFLLKHEKYDHLGNMCILGHRIYMYGNGKVETK